MGAWVEGRRRRREAEVTSLGGTFSKECADSIVPTCSTGPCRARARNARMGIVTTVVCKIFHAFSGWTSGCRISCGLSPRDPHTARAHWSTLSNDTDAWSLQMKISIISLILASVVAFSVQVHAVDKLTVLHSLTPNNGDGSGPTGGLFKDQ